MTKLSEVAWIVAGVMSLIFSSSTAADHAWGNYHWARSSNPFTVEVGDHVTSKWDPILFESADDWSWSSVLHAPVVTGDDSKKTRKRCLTSTGKVSVCNDTYGQNGWLGRATIYVDGDHITKGVAKLNDSYFDATEPPYDFYNDDAWRSSVMCQELGHLWGLGHNDGDFNTTTDPATCMDYSRTPAVDPNAHDYDMLESIYALVDSVEEEPPPSDTCFPPTSKRCKSGGSAADILAQIEMNGPAQWGRLVSAHGTSEVYALDFGGGRKVFTFVIWVFGHSHGTH